MERLRSARHGFAVGLSRASRPADARGGNAQSGSDRDDGQQAGRCVTGFSPTSLGENLEAGWALGQVCPVYLAAMGADPAAVLFVRGVVAVACAATVAAVAFLVVPTLRFLVRFGGHSPTSNQVVGRNGLGRNSGNRTHGLWPNALPLSYVPSDRLTPTSFHS